MAERKQKREQLHTPLGVLKYCHLNKPDTKFKEAGEYSVVIVLDEEEASTKALIKRLDQLVDEAAEYGHKQFDATEGKQKAKWKKAGVSEPTIHSPYEHEYDDEGDPTGNILIRFKTAASFKDSEGNWQKKTVKLSDAFGQVIRSNKRPLVYGGTEGRVAFTTAPVFIAKDADVYLGMYLNEVQIAKLVSSSGGGSSFGAIDGADFSADDLEEYEGGVSEGTSNDEDGDDDDLDDEIPF